MSQLTKDFNQGPRDLKQEVIQADFAIVGGGLAGVCAAIAAAREGLEVVLVQDRPVLGGNASSEVRLWSLGATSHMGNNNRWAREAGIIGEIMEVNLYRNPDGNPLIFDTVLLEFVRRHANIRLLLNTAAFDAETVDNSIRSIKAFNSMNATLYDIQSDLFCDASGDGILGYLSGADYRVGAENKNEFDEKFAPSEEYGGLMGHSIYFYSKDVGKPVDFVPPEYALDDITQIPRYRSFEASQDGCKLWWLEYGGRLDTVHDTEEIKWELWKVVYGVWDHIKNSGEFPEAETMTLEWVGHIPGKRESRRFEGDYMLNQRDLVEQKYHYDAVAFGGWSIDLHPAEGVYSSDSGCHQWHSKGVYQIPYRTMFSRNVNNLFITGRLISASHVAFASTRVMATCAVNGEVVGTAAALCQRNQVPPRELANENAVGELQQKLLTNGHYIPGIKHQDEKDIARQARVTASSTFALKELKHDGTWLKLSNRCAQIIPVSAGTLPGFTLKLKASETTSLDVSLRRSEKRYNHTPEEILEVQTLTLEAGEQEKTVEFGSGWTEDAYAFICLSENDNVELAQSDERVTGVLSLFQKCNARVAESHRQEPEQDIGVEAFDFWLPERRPDGKNIAIEFSSPLAIFAPESVLNGVNRPVKRSNTWVPAKDDQSPSLRLDWQETVTVKQIDLYLDNDFDHAMETVQWGHAERVTPFCVKAFRVLDELGTELYKVENNHLSHHRIELATAVQTCSLAIEILEPAKGTSAIFGVSCF